MSFETRLVEMIATRLCHDLTGPIGAVNNGAEFLGEEGFDMQNEAVQLILSSAHEAVNRLQFYRQAYGRMAESGDACLADKKKLASDFFSSTKVTLDWPDAHTDASGVPVGQKLARLILNLLIIAGGSLIRGGTLSVRVEMTPAGDKKLSFTAHGDVVKFEPETAQILLGKGDENALNPKSAQVFLTALLAQEVGATLALAHDAQTLGISVTQPAMALAAAG